MFETILFEKITSHAVIQINRPKVKNALNRAFWDELEQALIDVGQDDNLSVLIITGMGDSFSAGADLKESKTRTPEEYKEYIENLQRVSKILIEFPKPTIAAINGYAIGSGYELALACDLRIASNSALIQSPEALVSSAATGGASKLLQDLVGPAKAREIMFTGRKYSADECLQMGLVLEVVEDNKLIGRASEIADEVSKGAPLSLRLIKQGLLMASAGEPLEKIMEFEANSCVESVQQKERKDAVEDY